MAEVFEWYEEFLHSVTEQEKHLAEWEKMTTDRVINRDYSLRIVTDKTLENFKPHGESVQKALVKECNAWNKNVIYRRKRLERYKKKLLAQENAVVQANGVLPDEAQVDGAQEDSVQQVEAQPDVVAQSDVVAPDATQENPSVPVVAEEGVASVTQEGAAQQASSEEGVSGDNQEEKK